MKNFIEREVSWLPVCTGVNGRLFFFNFILYSMKTKFLCAVQMVPSCGLPVIFAILFFFLLKEKKKSQKGEKKKTSKVDV
jgi:hypothetical protein